MREYVRKYIFISIIIFSILISGGLCYILRNYWYMVLLWAYLIGLITGVILIRIGDDIE